jgi:hypothetical protein
MRWPSRELSIARSGAASIKIKTAIDRLYIVITDTKVK